MKGKREYDNLKRKFYYSLNKLKNKHDRRTKSVLIVDERNEKDMDNFFSRWEGSIELYKIRADSVEQVLKA